MTLTTPRPTTTQAASAPKGARYGVQVAIVALVSLAIVVIASLLPAWPAGEDMGATHYMGLLTANQPWNLLLFMAVPVILAETLAVTELVVLFSRGAYRGVNLVNRWAGLIAGFYFLGIFSYLLTHAVIPLTRDGGWRGAADIVAVGFYLLGLVPLYGISLMETGVLGARLDEQGRRRLHATFVGVFLIVAHVAMIFGMLDPAVLGWHSGPMTPTSAEMPSM